MSSSGNNVAPTPRFGRQWEVQVRVPGEWITLSTSDVKNGFEPLRVTFDTMQVAFGALWYGDITVYNLDGETQQTLLREGMEVIVNAGYVNGPYGEIFRGRVFQPMWDRENVVDFRTTLRCLVGYDVLTGFISANRSAFASQDDLVRQMAKAAITPPVWQSNGKREPTQWSLDVDESLQHKKLERGVVMFGDVRKYVDQIARDNYMQWWYDLSDQLHIRDITKNPDPNILVYTPQTGIVGTPQQTEDGVNFRVLLDPRLEVRYPAKQAKLDNTSIEQLKRRIGELPSILDKTNTYIVAGVRHIGDSRGNEWYSEVTGVTGTFGKLNFLSGFSETPSTAIDVNHG